MSEERPDGEGLGTAVVAGVTVDWQEIGTWVVGLRRGAGLEVAEAARKAGIAPETLRRLESGNGRPRDGTLTGIAKALGINPKDLFDRAGRSYVAPAELPEPPMSVLTSLESDHRLDGEDRRLLAHLYMRLVQLGPGHQETAATERNSVDLRHRA